MLWLMTSWILAAFGEEMVFRGYSLNRMANLPGRSRAGWVAGLIGSFNLFGFRLA
jgi:membrane protease YdiL (CAAX protease family)